MRNNEQRDEGKGTRVKRMISKTLAEQLVACRAKAIRKSTTAEIVHTKYNIPCWIFVSSVCLQETTGQLSHQPGRFRVRSERASLEEQCFYALFIPLSACSTRNYPMNLWIN